MQQGCFKFCNTLIFLSIFLGVQYSRDLWADSLTDPCRKVPVLRERVAAIRGYKFEPFECISLSEGKFNEYTKKMIVQQQGDNYSLESEEKVFKLLGILSPDFNYKDCANNGLLAIYDFIGKKLVIRENIKIDDSIIAHELVHVAQDQKYNLKEVLDPNKNTTTDSRLASLAVVEGDAVLIEKNFKENTHPDDEILVDESIDVSQEKQYQSTYGGKKNKCKPEEPLYSIQIFPYEWGVIFLEDKTEEQIASQFKEPPSSARNILYPTRDILQEQRDSVDLINKENNDQKISNQQIYQDVLGEFMLRNLLKKYIVKEEAILAAKEWRGDRLQFSRINNKDHLEWEIQIVNKVSESKLPKAIRGYLAKRFNIKIPENDESFEVIKKLPKVGKQIKVNFSSNQENVIKLTISVL